MTFRTTRNAGHPRSPVSSIPRTNLSTLVTVWRQGKSKIKHLLSNASPETRTAHESTCTARESTCRVPYEIVEMIIAHTAHNLNTLKACSLTCRSWHTAAAPLLNYAFAFRWRGPVVITKPESLPKLHKQGLLDLFTTIRVDSFDGEFARFTPQAFSHRGLYHFSAFTKVHTLELRHVAIGLFVPGAELYFGHLSPTLRSITLIDSHCHPPQLSHFLSLFPNLDDVEIRNTSRWVAGTTAPDTELVPLSAPKLRGRLILHGFDLAETWTDLIALCGGLRFHYMDLLKSAKCAPILLEACAGTLETLRLHTRDVPPAGSDHFDLSGLKALRSLQIEGWLVHFWLANHRNITIKEVFSTITSLVFSELVVVLAGNAMTFLPGEAMLFETLRSMSQVRPFKLVFSFEGPHFVHRDGVWVLAEARSELERTMDSMAATGFLNFLDSPPILRTRT